MEPTPGIEQTTSGRLDYADVKAKALALGFQKVGILDVPGDLTLDGNGLREWLARGFHGEMQWMAEHVDKRLNPARLMPGTKSILCVAMNYYPGEIPRDHPAKVARYAQGEDYHHVIKNRLKELLAWMKTRDPDIEGRSLTDSAPILEKALAVKAGLGWQGKHSNLITRDMGSWLFLGELLLNRTFADAPRPEPVPDLCGTCRRCLDACPTQAIVQPGVVDATRCISYWTIEYKGDDIPQPVRDNLNGWLFGCDICQEVCPWNIKFARETTEAAFQPRPWNQNPRPQEILTMDAARFRVRYRKSPVKRAKLHGLQRNARALLPQSGD